MFVRNLGAQHGTGMHLPDGYEAGDRGSEQKAAE